MIRFYNRIANDERFPTSYVYCLQSAILNSS
nr:MAG TPA_asm: hypothetical protein [Caudoviricetes sp.]DAO63913.1 MAG TPA: hypothetical protein [Caudoviricetes sp.]